ncbi:MAG: hypothetical protein ACOYBE_00005 [Blautia sp.]|jgi:N-acetylmuramoyl-L-alanine amidase
MNKKKLLIGLLTAAIAATVLPFGGKAKVVKADTKVVVLDPGHGGCR